MTPAQLDVLCDAAREAGATEAEVARVRWALGNGRVWTVLSAPDGMVESLLAVCATRDAAVAWATKYAERSGEKLTARSVFTDLPDLWRAYDGAGELWVDAQDIEVLT